jgi:hypothetical protein
MAELVWLYLKRMRDDGGSIVCRLKKHRRCNGQAVRASQPRPYRADNAVTGQVIRSATPPGRRAGPQRLGRACAGSTLRLLPGTLEPARSAYRL